MNLIRFEGRTVAIISPEDLEALEIQAAKAEYLTECPSCGEGPGKTGFPRMDEDGLCSCCGMDCSILGTVEAFKENEAQVQALTPQVARLEREKHDIETTLHRIVGIARDAGFQDNGPMVLSEFLRSRLVP